MYSVWLEHVEIFRFCLELLLYGASQHFLNGNLFEKKKIILREQHVKNGEKKTILEYNSQLTCRVAYP